MWIALLKLPKSDCLPNLSSGESIFLSGTHSRVHLGLSFFLLWRNIHPKVWIMPNPLWRLRRLIDMQDLSDRIFLESRRPDLRFCVSSWLHWKYVEQYLSFMRISLYNLLKFTHNLLLLHFNEVLFPVESYLFGCLSYWIHHRWGFKNLQRVWWPSLQFLYANFLLLMRGSIRTTCWEPRLFV